MARIELKAIVGYKSSDFERALQDAVKRVVRDDGTFNAHTLSQEFEREIGRKFSTWVRVPARYVEHEEGD